MCALCQYFTGTPDIGEKMLFAGYIDPGTGFVYTSIIPVILGFIATTFGSIVFFLRKKILPFMKKYILLLIIILSILIIGTIIFVFNRSFMNTKIDYKIVVIGLDGLDPKIVKEGFQKNLLPNLKKLASTGSYSKLETSTPPQSPVAWASFITGNLPARHGVFDFIERDPKTYLPDLVFSKPQKNPIQSTPFWEITSKHNIPTSVLFLPDTFPAPQFNGKMIAGMGVPDILGTVGSFTLYSTKDMILDPKWRGRIVKIPNDQYIKTSLEGPKYTSLQEKKIITIPVVIQREKEAIKITIQNHSIILKKGEFSSWIPLEFSIDFFTKIKGIARIYVKQINPDIEIYIGPLNFDPRAPVYTISSPKSYAKELSKDYGLFSTLGLPYDTWAMEENVFDPKTFLTHIDSIFQERKKIILGELQKFKTGLFVAYFGETDTIQHMFWRNMGDETDEYKNTILAYYQKADVTIGEVMRLLQKKDVLIVMSDHGFDEYDYEFNVNTWLKDNEYLVLNEGKEIGGELLSDVDWSKTKAYALGYNGIFINLAGREESGIVDDSEKQDLEHEIISKLQLAINPQTSEKIMKKIYSRKDMNIDELNTSSPDLVLGYYKSIRSSWDTAIGAVPKDLITKRTSKWSGDHLFDPTEIPGVIFVNKKIQSQNPRIIDIIPSIFKFLKIDNIKTDGKNIIQ